MKKYIADLHFGHEKIIQIDRRPFTTIGEMDEKMIKYWNQSVDKKDEIYILGDFAYRNEHDYSWYLERLKGKKHLIIGNHDYRILKDQKAQAYFESIHHMKSVKDNNREIVLFHYPILEWKGYYQGSLHLFGHIHEFSHVIYDHICHQPNMYNVGASIIDYRPASLGEIMIYNMQYKARLKQEITEKKRRMGPR